MYENLQHLAVKLEIPWEECAATFFFFFFQILITFLRIKFYKRYRRVNYGILCKQKNHLFPTGPPPLVIPCILVIPSLWMLSWPKQHHHRPKWHIWNLLRFVCCKVYLNTRTDIITYLGISLQNLSKPILRTDDHINLGWLVISENLVLLKGKNSK